MNGRGPHTRVTFIGWDIDTKNFTVSITKERRLLMISFLEKWGIRAHGNSFRAFFTYWPSHFPLANNRGDQGHHWDFNFERTTLNQASRVSFVVSDRVRSALAHIAYVLDKWQGQSVIFDRCWHSSSPHVTVYCDVAITSEPVQVNSSERGPLPFPLRNGIRPPGPKRSLKVTMREKKHSSTHLELINMLEAVAPFFAKASSKVLCYCDSKSAVNIAQARYSATANKDIEDLLRNFDVACCQRNLVVRFRWQSRSFQLPTIADALSRGQVLIFPLQFYAPPDVYDLSNRFHVVCV